MVARAARRVDVSDSPGYLMLEDALAQPELLAPPPAVVPRFAYEGRVTGFGSEPKFGKSTLAGQMTACLARGEPFLDEPLTAAPSLWLALDEPIGDVVRRLVHFGADHGVALVTQRPGLIDLETMIKDLSAKLLVVDTITEFAGGLVEDGNSAQQWQPVYAALRGICQRTNCAGLLLDHTGKANPHSLVGSLHKMAGCDLVLTMAGTEDSPRIRHLRARGRIACTDFSLAWDGERNTLHTGELSLDTRVFHVIAATPGLSRTKIRDAVIGKAKAIDEAISALERRGLIENRGGSAAAQFHVKAQRPGTGPGQGWDRPPLELLSDVGHSGTGSGQGSGQAPLSRSLRESWGQGPPGRVPAEEETERLAIAEEGT
jgi:hypothetical protein